jgi:hypothetical protein
MYFLRQRLSSGFEPGAALVESRLHIHHSELSVFDLAVRSHRPQEARAVVADGNRKRLNA